MNTIRIVAISVVVALALSLFGGAQAAPPPSTIRVQGSVSDRSGGTPVPANGTFPMTFRLYDAAVAGTLVATSGPSPVQVTGGLYNADVSFPPPSFAGGSLFLEVQINAETLSPRIPVVSVPYAYIAAQTRSVAPGGVDSASIAPGAVTPDKLAPCGDGQILAYIGGSWVCQPAPIVCDPNPGTNNPLTLSCYEGPAATRHVGACHDGIRHCLPSGAGYGACEGWQGPQPEICDNLDNDCNGVVDEGVKPVHSNGVGGTYTSGCAPLGTPGDASTYTSQMAFAARASYASGSFLYDRSDPCDGANALQRQVDGTTCATWIWSGPVAGHVFLTTGAPFQCTCPTAADPTWN